MNSPRKHALVAGVAYIISFVSIPTLVLYTAVHDPNFIVGPGPDTPVLIGGVLEMIVALAGLVSAVALYPIVKRQNQGMALGLVGTRTIEGAVIVVGVACLLTVVTLRQAGVGPEGLVARQALVGLYDRLFLLSQSTMPAFNALLLAAAAVLVPVGATGAADGGADRGAAVAGGDYGGAVWGGGSGRRCCRWCWGPDRAVGVLAGGVPGGARVPAGGRGSSAGLVLGGGPAMGPRSLSTCR
jgi:hypothetical protein